MDLIVRVADDDGDYLRNKKKQSGSRITIVLCMNPLIILVLNLKLA